MPEFTESFLKEQRELIAKLLNARNDGTQYPFIYLYAREYETAARNNYPAALDEIERLQKLAGGIFEHNVEDKCVVEYVTYKQLFEEALAIILLKK